MTLQHPNPMRAISAHFLVAVAIMSALIGGAAASPAVKPLVTVEEAEHLVMAELIHEHRNKLPGLVLSSEPYDPEIPSFWIISADWNGIDDVGTGGHYGYFSVDKMTGDVWEGTSACMEFHSRELAQAQWQLRRRLRMSARDYKILRRDGPYCGCTEPPVLGPCP